MRYIILISLVFMAMFASPVTAHAGEHPDVESTLTDEQQLEQYASVYNSIDKSRLPDGAVVNTVRGELAGKDVLVEVNDGNETYYLNGSITQDLNVEGVETERVESDVVVEMDIETVNEVVESENHLTQARDAIGEVDIRAGEESSVVQKIKWGAVNMATKVTSGFSLPF